MKPVAATRSTLVTVLVVIAFGIVLRLLGFFSLELWSDEGGWCKRLIDGDYGWIRPIGYMWITKQLVLLENNEQMLRSLSYVAGIGQLPLVYLALRRIVALPSVAVFGTYLMAIHPIAVAMTKEFKPYAMESFLHTLLVGLTLAYLATGGGRRLAAVVVTAIVAPLFAWTIIFAYPGVFLLLGIHGLRERKLRHVVATVLGCIATLAVLLMLFSARLAAQKPDAQFWGKKYDVFYLGESFGGRVLWSLEKTAEVATFPAHLQWFWPVGLEALGVLSALLCAAGIIAVVVKRRWTLLALLVLPWLLTLAFNAVGLWPYGLFRTNLFLLFYTLALVAVGVDAAVHVVRTLPPIPRRAIAALAIVLVVAAFPFDLGTFRHKIEGTLTAESSVRAALEHIYQAETGKSALAPIDEATAREWAARSASMRRVHGTSERRVKLVDGIGTTTPLIVMDGHACSIMRYYRDYHVDSRALLHDWLPATFVTKCSSFSLGSWRRTLAEVRGRSFWLVSSKRGWPGFARKKLAAHCEVVHDEMLPGPTLLYRCKAKPRAAVAPQGTTPRAGAAAALVDGGPLGASADVDGPRARALVDGGPLGAADDDEATDDDDAADDESDDEGSP